MYDYDYAQYLKEAEAAFEGTGFVTKDSGKRAEHPDGVVRDTDAGKPRFDLLFPKGIPFENQLMTRVAELYERGGVKYGMRNWEKSNTPETLEHHEAALMRHVVHFLTGTDDGEDHAAAVVWNVNAVDLCRQKIKVDEIVKTAAYKEPADDVFKMYIFPYLGKDTSTTGQYNQRAIQAHSYEEAQRMFDNWYATQRHYSGMPGIPETPLPSDQRDAELEWAEGDVLEEVRQPLGGGEPYTWVYHQAGDTWRYKAPGGDLPPDSARSSKKLFAEFGPLKCTKGSHTGRTVGGA